MSGKEARKDDGTSMEPPLHPPARRQANLGKVDQNTGKESPRSQAQVQEKREQITLTKEILEPSHNTPPPENQAADN